MLMEMLTIKSCYICGGLGYHRLLASVIDCVWSCVIGNVINEDEFIQQRGVFALLDLIEV